MKRIFSILFAIFVLNATYVSYAEDNTYLSDPLFERQWYYEAVHARAYRDNNIAGTGVKVGIIDSGFDRDLPDFNYDNINMTNVLAVHDGDIDRISDTTDLLNHGVAVTSIIAATADNGIGIAGLTDNVQVNVYKIQGDPNASAAARSAAMFKAIRMAYEDGCDVVNISYGAAYYEGFGQDIIDYATQDGMIIVAAVGNCGDKEETLNQLEFPAAAKGVIAVGAVQPTCETEEIWYDEYTGIIDPNGRRGTSTWLVNTILNSPDTSYERCSFSTANNSIFISAPSIFIAEGATSFYPREWNAFGGTSAATPIVTSAAIGVKQMRPYVDTDMFKEILKATSVDLDEPGYDINTGWGMVDFQAIYDYVSQMPETIPMATPEIEIDYENGVLKGFQGKYIYENYKLQEQVLGKYVLYQRRENNAKLPPNCKRYAME